MPPFLTHHLSLIPRDLSGAMFPGQDHGFKTVTTNKYQRLSENIDKVIVIFFNYFWSCVFSFNVSIFFSIILHFQIHC